ncbi:hypothetical protein F511_22430 [Dorcoceras hygrometricum]|uniref:Uncharacterized protein n=1 Tax=Dorcoceras hygrometricum TaxID=472368 RepID=A0A2Z7BYS0_9LAMI|nr:hypothetical protein F511_22430 [Dorcoceras hygrometricum]
MASSLFANTLQINFDSVLSFPDYERMVNMFKALESTGLRDVVDVPKYLVYDARSIFSKSGKPVKTSCKKRKMKYEFCLLNDILAKSVTVKAGSFDSVTHERFLLMTATHFGLKINWSKILFNILKGMVTKTSKQAKGFAAQICALLNGAPDLGRGEDLPSTKDSHCVNCWHIRSKNKNIGSDEDEPEEPVARKNATKRRPAPAVVEPVTKKKRTIVGRAVPAEKDLAMVPLVQNPEAISMVPVATPKAQHIRAPKRKLVLEKGSDDEIVDSIIHQVIADTTAIESGEPDLEEPLIQETAKTAENETDFSGIQIWLIYRKREITRKGYKSSDITELLVTEFKKGKSSDLSMTPI